MRRSEARLRDGLYFPAGTAGLRFGLDGGANESS